MTLSAVVMLLPYAVEHAAVYAPSPHDAHGWAIRVRAKGLAGPYFCQESPCSPPLEIILINKASLAREYVSFEHALNTGELGINLKLVGGGYVRRHHEPISPRPDPTRPQLRPGERISRFITLNEFGFRRFREPGEYIGQAELQTARGKVFSPPWKLRVVNVPPDATLDSHFVPGYMSNWHVSVRGRVFVQQIKVGEQIFLLKRSFTAPKEGGVLISTQRLAELPGKVEMTVEGVYENDKPLIIRYRPSPAVTTTLTIDSVNGTIWDRRDRPARDGDLRIDPPTEPDGKAPPGKKASPIDPTPKPAKP